MGARSEMQQNIMDIKRRRNAAVPVITLLELARESRVAKTTINDLENSEDPNTSIKTYEKIMGALDCLEQKRELSPVA